MTTIGGHPVRAPQRAQVDRGGPGSGAPGRGRSGQVGHMAVVLRSEEDLLAAALPWLDAGLVAGDLVVLTCPDETAQLLVDELGGAGAAVVREPRVSLRGARGPDAITTTRRLLDRAAGAGSGRLRVFGHPEFGSAPRDWREAQRYESAVNELLAGTRMSALCPYDERALPAAAVDSARATHPFLLVDGVPTANPDYRPPASYLAELPLPREPMEAGLPVFAVDGAPTLAGLRHQLAEVLARYVPDRNRCEDMHLAVSEIAANAFRHGTPPVSARVWAEPGWVVCTIADRGTGYADPLAGFMPAHGDDLSQGGMGLWLARKLWEHVDLIGGPHGLTVRLSAPTR
ncbi:anti-sigma factor RsbA family regulatory protein [Modestobacter sp. SYSU DS0875]